MLISNLRFLILFLSGLIILESKPFFIAPVKSEKIYHDPLLKNKLKQLAINYVSNDDLNKINETLKKDLINVDNKFFNFLTLNNISKSTDSFLEIDADTQYQENNIFYAEGNVIIYFSNATLRGDKLKYDRNNKQIYVEGNVIFSKAKQFFEASNIFYDLKNNIGSIDNIYGVLNIESINSDFDFLTVEEETKMLVLD